MVVSAGIPDARDSSIKSGTPASYQQIDLSPLDYLSKSVTVRLDYASPKVGDNWRKLVKRDRIRFWAVEYEVMKGLARPDAIGHRPRQPGSLLEVGAGQRGLSRAAWRLV